MRKCLLRSSQFWKKSLSTATQENLQEINYENAEKYNKIPRISQWTLIWKRLKDDNIKFKMDKVVEDLFDKNGPIFRLNVPGMGDRTFIRNPSQGQTLMVNDGKYPYEPAFAFTDYYRNVARKDLFPETAGLLGHNGEKWYETRALVQQDMLRPKSAMFYLQDIEEISLELIDILSKSIDSNQEIDDLLEYVNLWALESIVAIFLDNRVNCLQEKLPGDSEAKRLVNVVKVCTGPDAQDMAVGIPFHKYFTTRTFKRVDEASEVLFHITKKMVDQAVVEFDKNKQKDGEISVLKKLINKCGPESQIPIVMAQDAIAAGVDTTGTTAAFLMLDLARNQEKQEILFREIQNVIGDGEVSEAKLKQMKYLKACLHESQRLNPAVFGISRLTHIDMVLEGYQIPKGSIVVFPFMISSRDPSQFSNPDQFIPERWLRGCPQHHSAHPFSSIIFSHGPRMCIGKRFAELECYILAIKMLQNFKLEYHHGHVGVSTELVNKPDKPIKMKFVPRT